MIVLLHRAVLPAVADTAFEPGTVSLYYPPDSTPPQVVTVRTLAESE